MNEFISLIHDLTFKEIKKKNIFKPPFLNACLPSTYHLISYKLVQSLGRAYHPQIESRIEAKEAKKVKKLWYGS